MGFWHFCVFFMADVTCCKYTFYGNKSSCSFWHLKGRVCRVPENWVLWYVKHNRLNWTRVFFFIINDDFFYAIMLFQLTQILGRTQPITTFDIWWSGYGSIYHQLCMYGILRFILLPERIPWFICSQTWFYILHKYISSIYFFEKYIKPPKLYLYFFISSNHVI